MAATGISEISRSISDPLLNALPFSPASPDQRLPSGMISTNKLAHMAKSSLNDHAITATPTPTSPCNRTNDTGPLSKSDSAMGNSAVAPTPTPNLAKQPAVAPPSLTLQIPVTKTSSNGSSSARQESSVVGAQRLRRRQMPQYTSQLTNSNAFSPTLLGRLPYTQYAGRRNEFRGPAARVTHSNSRTWTKDTNAARQRWIQLERNMRTLRVIDTIWPKTDCPFVPRTFYEYLGHCASVEDANSRRAAFLAEQMNLERERKSRGHRNVECIFESRNFTDGLSPVLCVPTIWSNSYRATIDRPQAPWPEIGELKEEGPERFNSTFQRYLPLPRVPGNKSVVWKQKSRAMPSYFDDVNRLSDAIERGHQQNPIKEANEARWRRIAEEMAIALKDQKYNVFWAEKMEDALRSGLSEVLAEAKANAETMKIAEEEALAIVEKEEEITTLAEMREFLCENLINGLSCSDENKLEKEKNKENNGNKSNEKGSKNEE